jgi:hypothetical protein
MEITKVIGSTASNGTTRLHPTKTTIYTIIAIRGWPMT